jgi:hypothetical protein
LTAVGLAFMTAVTMAGCSSNATVSPPAAHLTSTWAVQSTSNPSGAATSSLLGVSCPSATACTAVGYYTNQANVEVALAEHWNGARWVIQPTAIPAGALSSGLSGVSCPSATACTAVGGYTDSSGVGVALAERWAGNRWTTQPTSTPTGATSGSLSAVSCPSTTACTAVGGYTGSNGVGMTLAERWTCPSITACTAVGGYTESTGTSVTLAEGWSGSGWVLQVTSNAGGGTGGTLSGVSCPSATACTAVGGYTNSANVGVTLAEYWDGSVWAIQETPTPTDGTFSSLGLRGGISCPSASACTAVGHYDRGSRVGFTLVERLKGTAWDIQSAPDASGATGSGLNDVSCPSATACTAVGSYTSRSGQGVTLAEHD